MARALVYARESVFVVKDGNRSTTEQVDESLAWIDQNGHEPVYVDGKPAIVDDGQGASSHSKNRGVRAKWDRVKRLLFEGDADGPIDMLVTWSSTRAQRDLDEYVILRRLCVEAEVLWCYNGRVYDMTDGDDRFRTAIDGAIGERDVEEIRKNVKRAMRANAKNGRPHGKRPFGYVRVYEEETGAYKGQEPHPEEAPVVRRVFESYDQGQSVNEIRRALNGEGVTTQGGREWTTGSLLKLLSRPTYIGHRTHNGIVTAEDCWPALVSAERWNRVQARMRARAHGRGASRVRLLTRVVRCGVCGARTRSWGGKQRAYTCVNKQCTARSADRLDAWVTVQVLARLADPDLGSRLGEVEDPAVARARAKLAELQGRLDAAVRQFTRPQPDEDTLTAAMLARVEAEVEGEIAEAERTIRSSVVPIDLDLPPAEKVNRWWDEELSAGQRRDVVSAVISAVVLHPVGRGRKYDMADVVTIEWRR
jgi:site-specific DNA recombinase